MKKKIIRYNGDPYLINGVQAQLSRALETKPDTFAEYEECVKPIFAKASELYYNTLAVSVPWKCLEKTEDVYDDEMLYYVCKYARDYGLTLHILWFGSNVCGDKGFVPAYISDNTEKYSRLKSDSSLLDYSDKDLIYREKKAYSELLKALYKYDTSKTVAVIQVDNEINFPKNNISFVNGQYDAIKNLVNELAALSKTGAYRCVTRVNFSYDNQFFGSGKLNTVFADFVNGTFVDAVGISSYKSGVDSKEIEGLRSSGNIAHIAESSGGIPDATAKMLYAVAKGDGLLQYELTFVPGYSGDGSLCVLKQDGSYRDGSEGGNITAELIGVNRFLGKLGSKIVTCTSDSKEVFNSSMSMSCTETASVGSYSITYSSISGGVGFAAVIDGKLCLYATRSCTFKVNGTDYIFIAENAADGVYLEIV